MKTIYASTLLLMIVSFSYAQEQKPKMDHLALVVSDLDKSASFYGSIIGLEEIEDKTQKDNIRWFGFGNGLELHLIQLEEQNIRLVKSVHLAMTVPDLTAFMSSLKNASVVFENWNGEANQSGKRTDGIEQIYLQDPDGYWIEVNNAPRF